MEDIKDIKQEKEVFDIEIEDISDEEMEEATRLALEAVDPNETMDPKKDQEEDDEVESLRNRLFRALADYDNLRKRTEREKGEVSRFALTRILTDLLSTLDNFGRALSAEGSVEDLKTGVEMIYKQFQELMGKYGVQEIDAEGQPFNPAFHEAVARVEKDSVIEPTVLEEFQKGYLLHDRLLRASMVRVAVPTEAQPEPSVDGDPESVE